MTVQAVRRVLADVERHLRDPSTMAGASQALLERLCALRSEMRGLPEGEAAFGDEPEGTDAPAYQGELRPIVCDGPGAFRLFAPGEVLRRLLTQAETKLNYYVGAQRRLGYSEERHRRVIDAEGEIRVLSDRLAAVRPPPAAQPHDLTQAAAGKVLKVLFETWVRDELGEEALANLVEMPLAEVRRLRRAVGAEEAVHRWLPDDDAEDV